SERSFRRYSRVKGFVRKVLGCVDLALMQGKKDAERIVSLGLDAKKASVTGNLKFDLAFDESETALTEQFRRRFDIDGTRPLIVAASTHDSEERLLMDALEDVGLPFRILFAPRHPERFDTVAALLTKTQYSFARRSNPPAESDKRTDIILLDSIGDLRSVFPLGDIVFVGGSLIPHGGQSILEPASVGRAIIVGPYTSNFAEVIKAFLEHDAIIQTSGPLSDAFKELLADTTKRDAYGKRALDVMNSSLGATDKTIKELQPLLT
ncbi:MAG: 3-deoxy-D-manno-octulosonic acid transferase, partial [Candidatus Binatia bacterium]